MSGRGALAGAIGNTVEWFDFAVYGYVAKEIGEAFFPADVPSLQLLSAFAVVAVGDLMRPAGAAAGERGGDGGLQPGHCPAAAHQRVGAQLRRAAVGLATPLCGGCCAGDLNPEPAHQPCGNTA